MIEAPLTEPAIRTSFLAETEESLLDQFSSVSRQNRVLNPTKGRRH